MDGLDASAALPLLGLAAGIVLGYTARANRFCTMAALERLWYAGDATGLRTWVLAGAVAMAATQGLILAGVIDISTSFYMVNRFMLSGAVLGGLMFGFGMALVGMCGFSAVVRLGGGNLRALVVLMVLGLAALSAQRGLLGQVRILLVDNLAIDLAPVHDQSIGSLLSFALGRDVTALTMLVLVGGALAWVFSDAGYRAKASQIVAGIVIGLVIPFGWLSTTWAAANAFTLVQLEAGSFVVPVGDTIMHFSTYTATIPDYGVGLVLGTLFGGALAAWRRSEVRWEACDDGRELGRHLFGAALMGIGGVFAMGCTVGQGLTGVSTMALTAPVVLVSIALGARLGLAHLVEGSVMAAFRRNGGAAHTPAE
ncbi:MAG: YeeE/YedE family protein [Rhodobiaceae bacterium]|nr:YeeE/YedE family protein [Rhodobiaceae bacterium]MCC0041504.1 YeeE/YedE family protein [Rhodobiaceae bacterium]